MIDANGGSGERGERTEERQEPTGDHQPDHGEQDGNNMGVALPDAKFARRHLSDVLKTERAQHHGARTEACQQDKIGAREGHKNFTT
jgi:hypothetical protein